MYILLKPLFSRHKGIGVQFTDEPTGNLDSQTSDKVIDLLKMTSRKFHQTIVMITHNPEIAEKADRRIRIEDGKIHPAEEERAAGSDNRTFEQTERTRDDWNPRTERENSRRKRA